MKSIILSLGLLAAALTSQAQYEFPLRWESNPSLHQVPDSFANESAVFVLDRRYIQYNSEGGSGFTFRSVHRIIKVLDDKGIESFNKITIPTGPANKVDKVRARTILPDGSTREISMDKIRLTTSEEGGQEYAFAMEGVTKGAEIEYLYTEKRAFNMFGAESFQFGIPVMKGELTLECHEKLRFEFKGYNGLPETIDTVIDGRNFYYVKAENVPALEEEPFSFYDVRRKLLSYKLAYAKGEQGDSRLFTWDELAKRIASDYYDFSDKDRKIVGKFLKGLGIQESDSEEKKIRKIEETLKTTIVINDNLSDPGFLQFDKIIEKKTTTEGAFIRFFLACLEVAGVEHEYGVTSNRFEFPLDEKFENWRFLDFSVVYFPNLDKYLSPSAVFYRMPFVPTAIIENKGIFCKRVKLGNFNSAVASIRKIPSLPLQMHNHDIDAVIRFTEDMTPRVAITHYLSGYSAMGLREAFVLVPRERRQELVHNVIDLGSVKEDIGRFDVKNEDFENYYDNRPLEVVAEINAAKLLEKAGPKYLFKIGDVIGRQSEMYQEKPRKLPLEMPFPHGLKRSITLEIPKGYKVANPEILRYAVNHKTPGGKETMAFTSDYKVEGNQLKITVNEFYSEISYPLTELQVFKNVINAAADFNKLVLVLEKI